MHKLCFNRQLVLKSILNGNTSGVTVEGKDAEGHPFSFIKEVRIIVSVEYFDSLVCHFRLSWSVLVGRKFPREHCLSAKMASRTTFLGMTRKAKSR